MEEKVTENMDEIKDIIAETGEEAKMLTKFTLPVPYSLPLHPSLYYPLQLSSVARSSGMF